MPIAAQTLSVDKSTADADRSCHGRQQLRDEINAVICPIIGEMFNGALDNQVTTLLGLVARQRERDDKRDRTAWLYPNFPTP